MAYYLAVEESKDSYKAINIKKKENDEGSTKKDPSIYECTLEEIDKFTSQYSDEQKLRDALYHDKIIQWCCYKSHLSIIYKNQDELRQIGGNLLYSDSRKYVEDYNLVIEYIVNKVRTKDTLFLDNLSEIVQENRLTAYFLTSIALRVNPNDTKYDTIVRHFAQTLIQECYVGSDKKTTLYGKIKYETLHKIIAFISAYEKGLKNENAYTRTRKPQ